jgi:hypothetical protein
MPSDSFSDSYDNDFDCNLLTRPEKPTIKILLYTDDPQEIQDVEDDPEVPFAVGKLKKFMALQAPACARLCPELMSRNELPTDDSTRQTYGTRKLDLRFLEPYEQIWFFGLHQVNKKEPTLGVGGGNPESELIDEEVAALCEWMKGGGVLMAGDHANPDPRHPINPPPLNDMQRFCPQNVDHERFLGLGRALGHRVPRAGRLRKWEGPPTRCQEDSINTQELACGRDYEDLGLQQDPTPQNIILVNFGEDGEPNPAGRPHQLFLDKKGCRIKVFPDHMHEGRLTVPRGPLCDEWPERNGLRPRPHVAAYGIDKRNGKKCALVAVYDGDVVGCGRIVADSTWHHYFNVNLRGFDFDGSLIRDQLGQFYVNLALWLSRLRTRREMACYMFSRLANHPLMLEEVGAGIKNLGRTALHILSERASPFEVHELLHAATPPELRPKGEYLDFPTKSPALDPLPSQDLILGAIMQEYHQELSAAGSAAGLRSGRRKTLGEALRIGFGRAFEVQASLLSESAFTALTRLNLLNQFRAAESGSAETSEG